MKVSLEKMLSLIDLTSLNDHDDEKVIDALCQKATLSQGRVAAVCVYPEFVAQASQLLHETPIQVATVVNFPSGNLPLTDVHQSIQHAIAAGAEEIDLVFPYTAYLLGDHQSALQMVESCKEICGGVLLKVILETGVLQDPLVITEVSRQVILAGADFLKTSSGKVATGATLEAARAMLLVIKEQTNKLERPLGFKVSGGVRTIPQAIEYIQLASSIMGPEWVIPAHFRIGASALLDEISLAFL